MSRTYKDQPPHIRFEDQRRWRGDQADWHRFDYEQKMIGYRTSWYDYKTGVTHRLDTPQEYEYTVWLKKPGVIRKKKKNDDIKYHWMGTPSAWTKIMMNRPQRKASKKWEREIVKNQIETLEDADAPPLGRKPHGWYW